MDQSVLVCTVCPNQPEFSDTSHLLTHVSSKGHLAHLHKLQVRSHQEIAAGVQLANYNQWYQRHGLARLLSERMQQKESRRARNPAAFGRKRSKSVKHELASTEPGLRSVSPLHKLGPKLSPTLQPRTRKREISSHEDEDYVNAAVNGSVSGSVHVNGHANDEEYLPGGHAIRPKHQLFYTPIKNYPAPPGSPQPLEYSPDVDPALDSALGLKIAKLKGKVWPGMALFDAATPDEQRRRNQKKDGSVLRRMERLSRLVDPQEAVYSPNLSLQKQRHLDELDEVTSLVDGEEPAPKPKTRVRKKPLAQRSSNLPRLGKRKSKRTATTRNNEQPSDMPLGLPNIAQLASSSTQASYGFPPSHEYSPSVDENMEFRLAIGNMSVHKRNGNYAIFNDQESPTRNGVRYSTSFAPLQSVNGLYAPSSMQPRLSFNSVPWMQQQQQASQQHYNPIYFGSHHAAQRVLQPSYQQLNDVGLGRDLAAVAAAAASDRASSSAYPIANPLIWKSPQATLNNHSSDASFGSLSGCFTNASTLPDPFSYSRNPLLDALVHLSPDNDDAEAEGEKCEGDVDDAVQAAASSVSSGRTAEIGDNETISDHQHETNLESAESESEVEAGADADA